MSDLMMTSTQMAGWPADYHGRRDRRWCHGQELETTVETTGPGQTRKVKMSACKITSQQLSELLSADPSIDGVLSVRQVVDGWEYLIRTSYVFPVYVIGWTDGQVARRLMGCGKEWAALEEWTKLEGTRKANL